MSAKIAPSLPRTVPQAEKPTAGAPVVIAPIEKVERPVVGRTTFDAKAAPTAKTGTAKITPEEQVKLCMNYGPAADALALSGAQASDILSRAPDFKAVAQMKTQFEGELAAAKTPEQLKALETKWPPDSITAGMQAKLMKAYMDSSNWGEAVRYYQSVVKAQPQFGTYDIPREHFIVCLNKSGQLAQSVQQSAAYLSDHGVALRDMLAGKPIPRHVSGEVFAGLGKALKVCNGKIEKGELDAASLAEVKQLAEAAGLPSGEKELANTAMLLSCRFYEAGFAQDFEYYPGINAVYNAFATGDTKRAEALAPMVMHACIEQGGRKSPDYWALATQLELAVIIRDPKQAAEMLPLVLKNGDVKGWMLDSTAVNVEALAKRRAAAGEDTSAADFVASKLRELQKLEPPAKPEWLADVAKQTATKLAKTEDVAPPTQLARASTEVLENSHTFKSFVSSYALGGNVQFGGQIPDICVSRETLGVARTVLKELGLERSDDFEKFDSKVDQYLARTYHLRDPLGHRRPLEDLHSPEHQVMDDFRRQLIKLMHCAESKDSRTDLAVELAIGSGDCRHVAYSKQLLFDVWKRDLQVQEMRTAYEALQKGDMPAHDKAMKSVAALDREQLAVFTVKVQAPMKMKAMYVMDTDAKGNPVKTPDGSLQDVEMHTLNALLTLSAGGEVQKMQWRDSFYHELYQWGRRDVDFTQILKAEGFDGGSTSVKTSEGDPIPVRMVTAPYSKGAARAGLSAGELMLAGQEVAPLSQTGGFQMGLTRDALVLAVGKWDEKVAS
jgi:hypothetical protein